MKAGWKFRAFSEVCELKKGRKPALRNSMGNDGLPYLSAKYLRGSEPNEFASQNDKHSICVSANEIIIICDGSNSGETFIGFDGVLSSTMAKVVHGSDLETGFLIYFLESLYEKFSAGKTGSAIPHLDLPGLRMELLPIPPNAEQRRIQALLDEAFDGITTAKANAEISLQNARALFESHLHSVFTYRGTGWVETTLGAVCELVGGSQPPKSVFEQQQTNDNVRLIQIRDYKSDKHIVFIPRKLAKRFCDADDVMIGRYGPPLFQILRGIEGAYNVALMKAVPDLSKLSRNFLFYFLKHSDILQHVIHHSDRAAGQIGITKETLEPYPIALPSHEVQESVVSTIMELETETQRLEAIYVQKLAALEDLKKSLLHQAFTGQL